VEELLMNALLMTAENGQKLYDRVKTQTRRLNGLGEVNEHADGPGSFEVMAHSPESPWWSLIHKTKTVTEGGGIISVKCPYRVGERRYIREPHYLYGRWTRDGHTKTGKPKYRFIADRSKGACYPNNPPPRVCTRKSAVGWFRRPGMFMFEWAARTIVEITEVRIQQVQEISADDAIDEGADMPFLPREDGGLEATRERIRTIAFPVLWDSVHGAGAWERNDWVWAVTMRRVQAEDHHHAD